MITELQDHKFFEKPITFVHINPVSDILIWVTEYLTSCYYTKKNVLQTFSTCAVKP